MRTLTEYRREYLKFRISETRRKLKAKAVEYKGGKCSVCRYDKCLAAFEFHHPDPGQKDFGIASGNYRSFERIRSELDKTILLCSNCHREIHDFEDKVNTEIRRRELQDKAPSKKKHASKSRITVTWPDKETLSKLVWEKPSVYLAIDFGVSEAAFKKHCSGLGISTPSRGYWARNSVKPLLEKIRPLY